MTTKEPQNELTESELKAKNTLKDHLKNLKQEDKEQFLKVLESLKSTDLKTVLELLTIFKANLLNLYSASLKQEATKLNGEELLMFNKGFDFVFKNKENHNHKNFIKLGKLISEDDTLESNKPIALKQLSYEGALKQRENLLANKDFVEALNNKFHVKHESALSKLNNLNSIIAKA